MKTTLLALAAVLCSCSSTNLSDLRKQDANDHSTLGGHVTSIYGNGTAYRVNPATNQDAKITMPDGTVIEVKSH